MTTVEQSREAYQEKFNQKLPRPLPSPKEKRLSKRDQELLEVARQGKREPEMHNWYFRIGLYGLSGRKAILVRPWESETFFWVEWYNPGKTTEEDKPKFDKL